MALQSLMHQDVVLLDEFNHRLFNTIHVVAIEISNCARTSDERQVRPLLQDLGARVEALAALHRLLASSNNWGLLEDHCRALCLLLVRVFGREDVTPSVRMEDVPLSCEQSLKVALIIVELVTNALKHSLKPGMAGTIWVDLRSVRGDVEICVCDSARAPVRSSETPRIVKALAESLDAKVFVADRDGYAAGVRIPHVAASARMAPIHASLM